MHKREGRNRKKHPQAHLEEVNCVYTKKDELSLEENTAILDHFIFRVERNK